ncbi:MAG: cell surface protein, partial [Muribaculum sp.]|nr:cell surface protein [Muribaculum sp.]
MKRLLLIIFSCILIAGCSRDIPMVNLGIDDVYYIPRMHKLFLCPALTGNHYEWLVDGEKVSDRKDYIFLAAEEGTYEIELKIHDPSTPYDFQFTVHVLHEEIEYNPYIS